MELQKTAKQWNQGDIVQLKALKQIFRGYENGISKYWKA